EEGRFAPVFDPVLINGPLATFPVGSPADISAGQRAPDLVANLKYAGTWGSFQVSGAAHQIRSNVLQASNGFDYGIFNGTIPDTEYGYAVTAQGSINLPMLAAGDALWLAATYANGALAYLGATGNITTSNVTGRVVDAYIGIDGDIETGEGWSIAGGLRHYWLPTVRQNVFGSYARIEYGNQAQALTGIDFDFNEWRLGTNVIWSPVAGLDIGVEVLYANVDTNNLQFVDGRLRDSGDSWEGRLRVQRDF
ncbi:porin, partial [Microvirga yunnanensis]|uniref:porin n=1 Tax=Microvirga yunnanensis TaxID=2953740 RepID=UPI0021CAC455